MKRSFYRAGKAALCAAVLLGFALPEMARATVFVYQFNDVFEGTAPEGPAPWIDATFSDVSAGVVQLTISATGMTTAESLGSLLLNFAPAGNPNSLSFAYVSSTGSFAKPTISTGENKFKADGDGKYDIDLSFSQKSSKIFTAGDSITFDITSSAAGLDALDFDTLSKPSADASGPFLAAAEFVCTTTSSITEWVAPPGANIAPVPEPSTVSLLAAGALVLFTARALRSRRARSITG